MKKIIAVILALVLLAGTVLAENRDGRTEESVPAGNLLGYRLLKELYSAGENCVLSPYSLALALGMAAEGAEGETAAQLMAALGVDDLRMLTEAVPEGITSANSAFVKPGMPLREEYAAKLNEYYGAEWFEIDGKVVEKLNEWVREKTNGLIDSMLADAPSADTMLLLLNAIAMDADWAKPFYKEGTQEEDFFAAQETVKAKMMRQTDMFRYAEKDGVQMICLPYYASGLEMWIALPAVEGVDGMQMPELLDVLAAEGSFYLTSDASSRRVDLRLPKFDVMDDHSLVEQMRMLGFDLPFDSDAAQFGGISEVPLYISEIMQKARVQVDEAGTKAAASTMIAMAMGMAPGMMDEPVEMAVNRPFVFVISDSASGSLCFAGVVENPAV